MRRVTITLLVLFLIGFGKAFEIEIPDLKISSEHSGIGIMPEYMMQSLPDLPTLSPSQNISLRGTGEQELIYLGSPIITTKSGGIYLSRTCQPPASLKPSSTLDTLTQVPSIGLTRSQTFSLSSKALSLDVFTLQAELSPSRGGRDWIVRLLPADVSTFSRGLVSSSSLSSAREWRLTERDGGLELDVREVIRGQKDAASAAAGGVGVPRDGEGGLVPVRIEWLVLAVRGGDSKRDGLLGKRPAQVGIVSCQAEEGVEVPGIVEIPDLIDGNAAKKGLRVLKAFRTAQTGPIIIKPTTPDQRYADIQQELKRMNRTVVEISVFCDENQDAKMNVYMVDTIVNSGIEDTFGMLGEISCRDGLGRASVGVMESTKTADQSILIVRFDVTGLARSGSKVLLSNTWAGDLLYSFKILRTSSAVRQYPALQTISYLENLNSEQNQFWGFVKNSRYFDRFMARNRSTPTKIGEDYSQIFLIVASTSFICLCVMSLVLIAKLGSPSKNLIDIVDIALLEEEAPSTNFKPGAGKYENSDTCCICMEDFTLDEEICEIKKCCHRLHPSCLEQWVIRNQQCPLCKTALILTRQVILVKKDKGKLFSTQGLSKKQIRSIESRLVIEPGPRIYFSRPIKKKAVKVLSSIQSQASQNQNPITQDSQQSRKSNPSKRARKLIALKKIKLPTHPKHKKRPSKRILRAKKTDKISRQRNGASKQPCETKLEDTTTDTGPLNQDTSSADLLPRIDQSFP